MARKMFGNAEVVETQSKGPAVPSGYIRVKLARGTKGRRTTKWVLLTLEEYKAGMRLECKSR